MQTLNRFDDLKKKKKPEPFLTGFLECDSINPKFKVKRPEPKVKVVIPKISVSNDAQKKKPNNQNFDIQNQQNILKSSNIPVKDVNDIFDLFGSSVKISENINNNDKININKSGNLGNTDFNENPNRNKNELNPNNMIDLVANLSNNQQKQNENIFDMTKISNNNINLNNFSSNDIKVSNDLNQNRKVNDLEEMLKAAYSNPGINQNDNNFINVKKIHEIKNY